jgi:transcriptional accessory protein Tex/SPT6
MSCANWRTRSSPGIQDRRLEVDVARKRVTLSMRLDDSFRSAKPGGRVAEKHAAGDSRRNSRAVSGNAFAEAFARAGATRENRRAMKERAARLFH